MEKEISNNQDIIDSRDIIERIEELQDTEDEEEQEELKALEALAEEAKDYSEWEFGAVLIRDDYFEEYARGLAEDVGTISGDPHWPTNCIDWEQAASELQMDYTALVFDGVTYWVR